NITTKFLPALLDVSDFRAVFRRTIWGTVFGFFCRNRNLKAFLEGCKRLVGQLFFLVGGIARLGRGNAISFDGFGQNDRRLAYVLNGVLISGVNLLRVVA